MNSSEMPSLMAELKAATQDLHTDIEACMPLFKKDFSKDQYTLLLQKFYAFFMAFESQLLPALDKFELSDFYAERLKTPALKNDLQGLNIEALTAVSTPPLTPLSSKAAVLGSLYVIEGSTLGGQLISKHLRQTLGYSDNQTQYFSGYGALTGPQWKTFQALMQAQDFSQSDRVEAINAARGTFKDMITALS